MNDMKYVNQVNWEALSTIASWAEIFLIIIPAVTLYIYYKISYVNFWVFNQTINGVKVAIHNKSKNSLFILNIKLIIKNKRNIKIYDYPLSLSQEYLSIDPDDITQINIDYAKYEINDNDSIKLKIQFGGKYLKKYKKVKKISHVCRS